MQGQPSPTETNPKQKSSKRGCLIAAVVVVVLIIVVAAIGDISQGVDCMQYFSRDGRPVNTPGRD